MTHTGTKRQHSAARAGLRFKKQQERRESCGVRRGSSVGALGRRRGPENNEKREERFERTRRTWMDMAGVKTFDLLVGVVLVWQCVRNVHAEIATSYGKRSQPQHRVRCAVAAGEPLWPRLLSVTGGIRHDKKM